MFALLITYLFVLAVLLFISYPRLRLVQWVVVIEWYSSHVLITDCWARGWSRCTGSLPTGDSNHPPAINFRQACGIPSQPKSVTAHRMVPNYTAWWLRHMHVSSLPKAVTRKQTSRDSNHRPFGSWALLLHHTGHYRVDGIKIGQLFRKVPSISKVVYGHVDDVMWSVVMIIVNLLPSLLSLVVAKILLVVSWKIGNSIVAHLWLVLANGPYFVPSFCRYTIQEIGYEGNPPNDLFCIDWGIKP